MTSLERMTPAERKSLCRMYFFIGLLGLPLVWLVNAVWFAFFIYGKPRDQELNEEEKSIRRYIFASLVGALLWAIALAFWLHCYTTNRALRVEWAETLTFLYPLGRV